ncbi:hypothetical protein A7X85_22070 [Streptomyces sp. ST1015]|nr:hypothetical protein A7X85_22070 [Streptomyces sp. ST1015]
MVSGRAVPAFWHVLLVWGVTAFVMPVLGVGVFVAGWGGGNGAAGVGLLVGVPMVVGLLAVIAPAGLVSWCGTKVGRFGWAVLVFVLGTAGILAGLAAYNSDVDLGGAATRIALTGLPYAVAAALLVPDRWVRLGAVVVLVAGVGYGGYLGPSQVRDHERAAQIARYRAHPEVLYLGATPPGMRIARAVVGSSYFGVEYHAETSGYVGMTVRSPLSPRAVCPDRPEAGMICAVGAGGEVRQVRSLPGGGREVTLFRRYEGAEVEVRSQSLGEAGLRRVLDTLHPLSEGELEGLMREKVIGEG